MSSKVNVDLKFSGDVCFIDVETTGTVFGYHEVIDIGCVRANLHTNNTALWEQRIRPKNPERITEMACEVNGFSIEKWAKYPESSPQIWRQFFDFSKDCVPVCHNPSFDRAFISLEAAAQGVSELGLNYHWIGTESLAWPLYASGRISKLSLSALCEHFDLAVEPSPHTALNGAKTCCEVYKALTKLARF